MRRFKKAIHDFVYPHCCICCGESIENYELYICDHCSISRFESSIHEDLILPESVIRVYSMWKFDKGGYLQEILHQVKYNRMKGAGNHLGRLLGTILLQLQQDFDSSPILVPVPLHPSKERYRGFNQARVIAEGISGQTNWPIIEKGIIERVKKTTSQTGLTTEKRAENLKGAFAVSLKNDKKISSTFIVDDVFTTGTTTYELAKTICNTTGIRSNIVTVAAA